jgi:predicted RND superfamily exporter protein
MIDKILQFIEDRPSQTIIGLFIIIIVLVISLAQLSPAYNWVICQHERCWKAQSYRTLPNGVAFQYDGKKYEVIGDYLIKEK